MEKNFLYETFFTLKTPYNNERSIFQKSLYIKEKSKFLTINYQGKILSKLHHNALEGYFEPTLALFHENALNLPDETNPNFVETIVKYIYFNEIDPIPMIDIFDVLNLSFFLKIDSLNTIIMEFLMQNIEDVEKTCFILKNTYKFLYIFKEEGKKFIKIIIDKCYSFLIKNNHIEQFSALFDKEFFLKFSESILMEEIFENLLKMLKKFKVFNEIFFLFISIFKEALINYYQQKDRNFNEKAYLTKIFEENLDIKQIDIKNMDFFQNMKTKDFIVKVLQKNILENQHKILQLSNENIALRKDLNKTTADSEKNTENFINYQIENNIFQEKILKSLSDLKNKQKDFMSKMNLLHNDKISHFLLLNFPQFNDKILLFDSNDELREISKKITGYNNVVMIFELQNYNFIFGAYFSIPLPQAFSEKRHYQDENSCVFEINSNIILKANFNENSQICTDPNYFYYIGLLESIFFIKKYVFCISNDLNMIWWGNDSSQFEKNKNFGYNSESFVWSSPLRKVMIYQLLKNN